MKFEFEKFSEIYGGNYLHEEIENEWIDINNESGWGAPTLFRDEFIFSETVQATPKENGKRNRERYISVIMNKNGDIKFNVHKNSFDKEFTEKFLEEVSRLIYVLAKHGYINN